MTRLLVLLLAALTGAASVHGQPPPPSPVRTIAAGYSFTREPFVDPRILDEMTTWMSDRGDLVVEVGLAGSDPGDEIEVREVAGNCPFVQHVERDGSGDYSGSFGYRYVGMTRSGVHVLRIAWGGGGSATWTSLLFLAVELRHGIGRHEEREEGSVVRADRERIVARKLGTVAAGDRWSGELRVRGNEVFVGKDQGWFTVSGGSGGDDNWLVDRFVTIDIAPSAPLVLAGDETACNDRRRSPPDESRPREHPGK